MKRVELDDIYAVANNAVLAQPLGRELAILDAEGGEYYTLNEVGARVWDHLKQGGSLAAARDALLAEYEVPAEVLHRDLLALVADLESKGLLKVRHGSAS